MSLRALSTSKRRLALTAAFLAVPAALVTTYASAAQQGPVKHDGGSTTITLVERDAFFHLVDVPPRQKSEDAVPTAGDQFVLVNTLLDHGKRVGSLHASCVVTRNAKSFEHVEFLCNGVFRLPGGQIMGEALVRAASDTTDIAILGGTGKYAGANGTMRETPRTENTTNLVITLTD